MNTLLTALRSHKVMRNLRRANGLSMTRCHELEMLREVKDVNRVQVDNYHLATLATIKHRSDMIESADDNDEIEWTEDPYECKSQPATAGSPLFNFIQIQGPHSLRILSYF
jgi:hypothetical protein